MELANWPKSERAWHDSNVALGGGVSSGARRGMKPFPLEIVKAHGARLRDADGNEYIDYVLGWGPVLLGHADASVNAAVSGQLEKGTTYGSNHVLEYQVAERLRSIVPGLERVLWTNTGSEATQIAIRLARAATGRRRFLKFEGAYHGWSDMMLVGYRKPKVDGNWQLESAGQSASVLDDVAVAPFGDLAAVEAILTADDADIAAIIVDPVLSNSGVITPPVGFLEGLRELCDRTGTILVFDEVLSGFRIGRGGGVTRFNVIPDLVVLAKAIASGFPLAMVGGKAELVDEVTRGVLFAGTYNGNPVSLAAADATLTKISEGAVYEHTNRLGTRLAGEMRRVLDERNVAATVNQAGSLIHVLLGVSGDTTVNAYFGRDQPLYDQLRLELLRRGVHSIPDGRWYLSMAHTERDIDTTIDKFDAAIAAVQAQNISVSAAV